MDRAKSALALACVFVFAAGVGVALGWPPAHHVAAAATSGCFQYSVRTDRSSYHLGVPVKLLVTATNIGTHPCLGRPCGGITPSFEVFDAVGQSVYVASPAGIECVSNPAPPPVIQPSHAEAWTDGPWDQLGPWTGPCRPGNCHPARTQVPPGPYRINWRWLDTLSVSTGWFWLTP